LLIGGDILAVLDPVPTIALGSFFADAKTQKEQKRKNFLNKKGGP